VVSTEVVCSLSSDIIKTLERVDYVSFSAPLMLGVNIKDGRRIIRDCLFWVVHINYCCFIYHDESETNIVEYVQYLVQYCAITANPHQLQQTLTNTSQHTPTLAKTHQTPVNIHQHQLTYINTSQHIQTLANTHQTPANTHQH